MSSSEKVPAGFRGCGNDAPEETWKASTPACSSQRHTCTDSSSVEPFFSHGKRASLSSTALILNWRW
jgi:hypothetical protein